MTIEYLLDTNICIYLIKKQSQKILHKFEKLPIGSVGMSIITYGELAFGAKKSLQVNKNLHQLEELITFIPALELSIEVAKKYGDIRSKLEKKGKIIGNNDLWIASHALALDLTLVTNNTKEFLRVTDLKVENWV